MLPVFSVATGTTAPKKEEKKKEAPKKEAPKPKKEEDDGAE